MPDGRLRIFVLGSFVDTDPRRRRSIQILRTPVSCLRSLGWDAFLSGDPRSRELVDGPRTPRQMTDDLEAWADLSVVVATVTGRSNGWVSELTALQFARPERAPRRALFLERGYTLSSMMDPLHGGYLARPPVLVFQWVDRDDLCAKVDHCARFLVARGHLPRPVARPNPLRRPES